MSIATKRDYQIISIIAGISGLLLIPTLQNLHPAFWSLSLPNAGLVLLASFAAFNLGLFAATLIAKVMPGIFRFAKYAATGVMNLLVDFGVLNFLGVIFRVATGWPILVFNVLSFFVAMSSSYFWNNTWAFGSKGTPVSFPAYFKFLSVSVIGVVANTAILYAMTAFGPPGHFTPESWENLAKLVSIPVSVLINYIGYTFFVFK